MNWEDSKACTPLKRDFLKDWFALEQRFFLTSGSALGLFYLDHGRSYDLDLFTDEDVSAVEVQAPVMRVAAEIGAECEGVRSAPDIHRFRLSRDGEREIIDVVVDRAPQLDGKENFGGIRVDTVREILANKLTTLLSQSEMKDVVDLYFLEQAGYDVMAAIPDSRSKDGGWEPAVVSMLLDGLRIDHLPAWIIRAVSAADLQSFLSRLRLAIAKLALPNE